MKVHQAQIVLIFQASEEEKAAFREAAKPIFEECSKEHGVSIDELKAAKEAGSADGINPCFMGCVYKKVGVVSSNVRNPLVVRSRGQVNSATQSSFS